MLVSTFELLVTPIAPNGSGPSSLVRNVVQAYFLNIANPNDNDAYIELQFTATTPNLSRDNTVIIRDVIDNKNEFDELMATGNPKRFIYNFMLPAHDTALIDLQPDVSKQEVLEKGLEVRGYVEIFLRKPSEPSMRFVRKGDFLLSPEHRGTFFKSLVGRDQQLDQEALGLPTATGSSLFSLSV